MPTVGAKPLEIVGGNNATAVSSLFIETFRTVEIPRNNSGGGTPAYCVGRVAGMSEITVGSGKITPTQTSHGRVQIGRRIAGMFKNS